MKEEIIRMQKTKTVECNCCNKLMFFNKRKSFKWYNFFNCICKNTKEFKFNLYIW